jgi:hypothetical protein
MHVYLHSLYWAIHHHIPEGIVFVVTAMGTSVITLHLILQHQSTKKIALTSGCLYYSAGFFTNAFVFVKEKGKGHPVTLP